MDKFKKVKLYFLLIALLSFFGLTVRMVHAQPLKLVGGDIYVKYDSDYGISSPDFLSYNSLLYGDSGFILNGDRTEGYGNGSEKEPGNAWIFNFRDSSFFRYPYEFPGASQSIWDYLEKQLPTPTPFGSPGLKLCESSTLPADSGYYSLPSNAQVDCSGPGDLVIPGNRRYVFFVSSSGGAYQPFHIKSKIKVEKDGFFALIVQGNIVIQSTVDGGSENEPDISGFFATNGTIRTGNSNNQLYLEGIYLASTFELERRDPGGEIFIYRPDFLVSAPSDFYEWTDSFWQSAAP